MAGELWRSAFQIGKETTPNTTVAATRKLYFNEGDSRLTRERAARPRRYATGGRQNLRAMSLGSIEAGGSAKMPLSSSEIVELMLMGISGGVTPTGAGAAKLWTFVPGTSLDSATVEWYDGARGWEEGGVYVSKITIEGSVSDETTISVEFIGMSMETTTITAGLSERVPGFIEGWETKLFVDAFGATPGTTQVDCALINWSIEIDNQMARKYAAKNSQEACSIVMGELEVKAKLTLEASQTVAATEFANWDAVTERLVRLDFGNNVVIDGSDYEFVTVDVPGAWESFDLGGSDEGTRTYELGLQYIYDPTNAFGLQIRAQNDRAAAWV